MGIIVRVSLLKTMYILLIYMYHLVLTQYTNKEFHLIWCPLSSLLISARSLSFYVQLA